MKIVVSSKLLTSKIKQAIISKATFNEVSVRDNTLTFHGDNPIEIYGSSKYNYQDREAFISSKWARVMLFLDKQPEQSITVSITESCIDIACVACF